MVVPLMLLSNRYCAVLALMKTGVTGPVAATAVATSVTPIE